MNTTIMNTLTDTNAISTSPLTENELDVFQNIIGGTKQIQALAVLTDAISNLSTQISEMKKDNRLRENRWRDDLLNIMNKFTESQSKLSETVANGFDAQRKSLFKLHSLQNTNMATTTVVEQKKLSPLFYSTLEECKKGFWKGSVSGEIDKLCFEGENKGNLYHKIYTWMKEAGYDVQKLLAEYKTVYPDATFLDMCAASDVLRLCLQNQINRLVYKKTVSKMKPTTNNKKKVYKIETRKMPDEIRNSVLRLSSTGKPSGLIYNKAMNMIKKDGRINVNKLVKTTCKKHSWKTCSPWFAISQDAEAVNIMNQIITEYLERENNE